MSNFCDGNEYNAVRHYKHYTYDSSRYCGKNIIEYNVAKRSAKHCTGSSSRDDCIDL